MYMKNIVILISFLLSICFFNCQSKNNNNIKNPENDSIIAYNEYINKESVIYKGKCYYVIVKVLNKKNDYVVHKDEKYYDREVYLTLKDSTKIVYEKKIPKVAFQKYFKKEEFNAFLIYNCYPVNLNNNIFLFRIELNLCEPEGDNCISFNVDFNKKGEYEISEEEITEDD
jgi:hypothetical protein